MTLKIPVILILTIFAFTVHAQELSAETKRLVGEIAKVNELDQEHVGYAGVTTDQYINFTKLRDEATTSELLALLKYKNWVVRGYASWALTDNKYPHLADVFVDLLESEKEVTTMHGCIEGSDNLGDEFYYRVYGDWKFGMKTDANSTFYKSQILKIDSVILFNSKVSNAYDVKLYSLRHAGDLLSTALDDNNANPSTYNQVREIALNGGGKDALVALAKYQKQEDIAALIKKGKESFMAISFFPNEGFWDFITGNKKERSFDYFLAVSGFKNKQAGDLLNDIYPGCDSAQMGYLDEALSIHYCSLYQDLILKIWAEQKSINAPSTRKLITEAPSKATSFFEKGLLNSKRYNFLKLDDVFYGYQYNILHLSYEPFDIGDTIIHLMLQHISKYDSGAILNICIKNIAATEFTELHSFIEFIEEKQMKSTTNALMESLRSRTTAYDIFSISHALLSFNNPDVSKQTASILKGYPKNWDWGNWSDAFRKLFGDNGIEL